MRNLYLSHGLRWILPVTSCVPVVVGLIGMYFASEATDEGASAMALAFIFFPIAFILALISALVARARREAWSRADKVISYAPLCLFLGLVLVGILYALLSL